MLFLHIVFINVHRDSINNSLSFIDELYMTEFFLHLADAFQLPLNNPILIFSLMLLIILLSPIILRKLKIPSIIGLILAGIAIGPYGFGILENGSSIELFSTIGLLYILFLAGLDLDMNGFKTTRYKSLFFGVMTFIFPFLIGFPVCRYLLDYNFSTSLLISSMFATHTLVSYPIVSKFGVAKNLAVAITVGGTIITDTLVLILLAVILDSSNGSLNLSFFVRLGISLLIFSLIMFWLIPIIAKWFFQKLESEKHSHYIFVLSVMFFAAFLAEMSGLEPIIGAFVAGLVLNRFIPNSSPLMNRIDFIGNSLFIPFFLISVGMLVDLRVLIQGPRAIIITVVLALSAFASKWIAAFITQRAFRLSGNQRRLIFGLSSSRAAATLAIILAGYQAGIINSNVLNGTIILILITCVVSSFVTERAAHKIAESENKSFNVETPVALNAEHILLPILEYSDIATMLDFAILLKDRKSSQPISILSVVPNDKQAEINIMKAKNKLENFVHQGSSAEVKVDILTTIDHNTAGGIARISREIIADSIVIEWPGKLSGMIDKLMGDTMARVVKMVEKNIYICRIERPLLKNRRILLMTTPFAELESGFKQWFLKLIKLSNELSIPIEHFGDEETKQMIFNIINKNNLNAMIHSTQFSKWENFDEFSSNIHQDDLIVLVSSRQGFVSYVNIFEQLIDKLTLNYPNNNKVAVYPMQTHSYAADVYEDISSETITSGWETIQRIVRKIKIFLKKDKHS